MVILKILTNKWTYIILALIGLICYISSLHIMIKSKNHSIEKLNSQVESLKTTNLTLQKDIEFQSNRIIILESFSNSQAIINKVSNYYLSDDVLVAYSNIINDYHKVVK